MTFLDHWLLTILLLIPVVGGTVVLFLRSRSAVRFTTLGLTIAVVCGLLFVLFAFHRRGGSYAYPPTGTLRMVQHLEIVSAIHWNYRVGVDGLSLPFLLATSVIGLLACIASWDDRDRAAAHFAVLLGLEATALGAFASFDLLLLCTFVALSLAGLCAVAYLERDSGAGTAIVLVLACALPATACLLVGTLGLRLVSTHCFTGGSLDLVLLASRPCAERSLWLLMLIGFLLLLPAFPLHALQNGAIPGYTSANPMLVGLIPLIGGYGLLRVVLPIFALAAGPIAATCAILGTILLLYFALSSIGSEDVRSAGIKLWLGLVGLALIGVATLSPVGLNGAILILLGQGLIAPTVIALTSLSAGSTGAAGSARGLIVGLAVCWLAELVIPTFLGGVMVLLGLFTPPRNGLSVFSNTTDFVLIGTTCLGVVLIGAGGISTLHAISRAQTSEATRARPFLLSAAVAAALFAMLLLPLCFIYTRNAITAMLFDVH